MNSKDILETEIPKVLAEKPELAKDINAIIHFDIAGDGGGKWTLDTTKSEGWVSEGLNGASKMTVIVSNEDFVKIREKKLNAQMAAMQGKLKFKPMDMGLAMKLAKLLG
ncbi:SCP2 sterol-binding domain-containing protein [Corallococcus sicarius]|uniref:SCP-2 sterol transfer family protein n=1 Tax=Corallococcus sicarius TaxID=2316726 RepID=A0A3A8NP84_9BACT|nr:SCP2 sterol-binding domain-containing protein [Corallococcus sicarius]RKH41214.1 SCP-2 sterol transfer family protein [Corallococcus sicarius]